MIFRVVRPLRNRFLLFLLLFGWLTLPVAQSQPQDLAFEPVLKVPGAAIGITQDKQGFMWFGTWRGLYRYDGYEFKVFVHDPADTTSLSFSRIESIYVDHEGILWVGTLQGLNRFDATTETFQRFQHDPDDPTSLSNNFVTSMLEDREGNLWVGTHGGLNRLDRSTGRFVHFRHDPNDASSLSNDQIRVLYEDREGTLWVGTGSPFGTESPPGGGGLNRMDHTSGTFRRYLHNPEDLHSLRDNHITALFEDSRGVFWVGTWSNGLHQMDRRTGSFTNICLEPCASGKPENPREVFQPVGGIAFIREDSARYLWIGTHNREIYRVSPERMVTPESGLDPDRFILGGLGFMWRWYESRDGTLWLGGEFGLLKISRLASGFDFHSINRPGSERSYTTALHVDRSGSIWFGAVDLLSGQSAGLVRYDRQTRSFEQVWKDSDRPGEGVVISIQEDPAGVLWFGTVNYPSYAGGALHRLDPVTGSTRTFRTDPNDPNSLAPGPVIDLTFGSEEVLWIASWGGGLNRLDIRTGWFTRYTYDPDNFNSLRDNRITGIHKDAAGILWIATGDPNGGVGSGISRFDPKTGQFTHFEHDPEDARSLSDNAVMAIAEDLTGKIWIGTYNEGLNRFDRATASCVQFSSKNSSLPIGPIQGIVTDHEGLLWISYERELVRFDPQTYTVQTYPLGRFSQLEDFGHNVYAKDTRGELFFGGLNGFISFSPVSVRNQPTTSSPEVILTEFRIFDQLIRPGSNSPLHQPIWETDEIVLAHNQNVFSFGFAGIHYGLPAQNRHLYRLEPYEESWREAGSERTASYIRVPPGAYVFRVRAANAEGVWNEEGRAVRIVVLPPWWRTWWAYSTMILLLTVILLISGYQYRRKIVRKEREKARLREQQLRIEAAEAWAKYLEAENQRQTQELEQAQRLQLSMLPEHVPVHPNVEIAARMKTAAEVGGDYYDFDVADDGTLTFAIGDATGHGVQAGTMVTAVKSLFTAYRDEEDIIQVLHRATGIIRRMHLHRLYMALALGKLKGSMLELAGAGMPPAFLYRAASGDIEAIALKGLPLGGSADFPYTRTRIKLEPSDTLVLMSDGFPELFNEEGEMLGYDKIRDILREVAYRSPEEIIEHFSKTAQAWSNGHLRDDMTFVVLRARSDLHVDREKVRSSLVASASITE